MGNSEAGVDHYRIEPLAPQMWDAFADLAERHNGVWGGCWCTWFHRYPDPPERKALGNRQFKRLLGVVRMPDYRITCLFVDCRYRRTGMAMVAVQGALALIAAAGGGLVESCPHDLPAGKKTSASFLYNATRSMYEQLGFDYERPKGQGNCVMSKVVSASSVPAR